MGGAFWRGILDGYAHRRPSDARSLRVPLSSLFSDAPSLPMSSWGMRSFSREVHEPRTAALADVPPTEEQRPILRDIRAYQAARRGLDKVARRKSGKLALFRSRQSVELPLLDMEVSRQAGMAEPPRLNEVELQVVAARQVAALQPGEVESRTRGRAAFPGLGRPESGELRKVALRLRARHLGARVLQQRTVRTDSMTMPTV